MKFNFRKIASVFASVVMLGSTVGIAAAATTYPAPFVAGGASDVAIIYGEKAAFSDGLAAGEIQSNLQFELGKQTASGGTTSTGTVSGEAAPLFTGGSKIYVNDTLNSIRATLTKSDLPTVLADYTFSGNVDAKLTSSIVIGSTPQIIFAKQPTTSDDPNFGLSTSTTMTSQMYNATVDFGKAVNFTHADSKNQELKLFGQKFTVSSGTDATSLILFKEATKVDFDSSGSTSQEVTIGGATYTVEMVSASTSAATIKVTNAAGASEQKEVNEGYSKKINGVTVAVNTADSNNLKYTASVVAGAEKITLKSGSTVKTGDSDTTIDGTNVDFTGATTAMTKLIVSVAAKDSDTDAIKAGKSFVDPVFGSFKVDFPGLNIADDSTATAREDIKVYDSGNDKSYIKFTDARGNEKAFQWAYNVSTLSLQSDDTGHNIIIGESTLANVSDYVILGNADEGRILKVKSLYNDTDTVTSDYVTLQDVMTGTEQTFYGSSTEGTISLVSPGANGKSYTATINFANSLASEARQVRINAADSTSANMIIYPSVQTSKGAKIMFYKPLTIDLNNMDGAGTDVTGIQIPNCDQRTYQTVAVALSGIAGGFNVTAVGDAAGAVHLNATLEGVSANVTITNTGLKFWFNYSAVNTTAVRLYANDLKTTINQPALVVCEEKDDNSAYNAVIVTLDTGSSSSNALDVSDVIRTWWNDGTWDSLSTVASSNIKKEADLYGAIITTDSSTSGHSTATISYPDTQVYADLYVGAAGSVVTPGTASGGSVADLGYPVYKDSEITSVSTKNLLVVGGSCINTVAAKILGSDAPICGAAFTTATGVGANQALVKVVASPYSADKVAMLVAGYEAADTTKAVKYVTTGTPATDKDTTKKLSTSSSLAVVVE